MNQIEQLPQRHQQFQFVGQNFIRALNCSSIKGQFRMKTKAYNTDNIIKQYMILTAFIDYYSQNALQFKKLKAYIEVKNMKIEGQGYQQDKIKQQLQFSKQKQNKKGINNVNKINNQQISKTFKNNTINSYIQSVDKIFFDIKNKYKIKQIGEYKIKQIRQAIPFINNNQSNNTQPDQQKLLHNAKRKLQKCEFRLNQLNSQYNIKCAENKELKLQLQNFVSYDMYFHGNVFSDNRESQLQWFVDSLQQKISKRIHRTNLIYRMDLFNKTNFHKYIDQISHIVILIKLTNGNIIGGYSQDKLSQENQVQNKPGYLFSFKERKIFSVKYQDNKNSQFKPKAVVWDEYYLIFGNSEIRIKLGQAILYSNFGIINSYYNAEEHSIDALIGEGKNTRQIEIQTYEIFEIKF